MRSHYSHDRPVEGDIIQSGNHAYRVVNVRDMIGESGYDVHVLRLTGHNNDPDQHYGMTVKNPPMWKYLGEHFEVCFTCMQIPPCDHVKDQRQAERDIQHMQHVLSVPEGACHACGEAITVRQKTYEFPGPNLLNPLAADGVRFHARQKCRSAAAEYENKWVDADPNRERSLLTLNCDGTLVVHTDGTADCIDRDKGSCPHIYAAHGSYAACYIIHDNQCAHCDSFDGHPGTRLAPDLRPDGTREALM